MFQRVKYRSPGEWKTCYFGVGGAFAMTTWPGSCVYFEIGNRRSRIARKDAAGILRGCRAALRGMEVAEQ